MADIQATLELVPEALGKLTAAYEKAISDGITRGMTKATAIGATRNFGLGISDILERLSKIKVTEGNQGAYLGAGLSTREFGKRFASLARATNDPELIQFASIIQENANRAVSAGRHELERARKVAEKEQLAVGTALERELMTESARLKYNRLLGIAKKYEKSPEDFSDREVVYLAADLRTAGSRYVSSLRKSGATDEKIFDAIDTLTENARRLREVQEKNTEAQEKNTSSIREYKNWISAGATGVAVGNYFSNMAKGYYANRVNPYTELGGKIDDAVQNIGGIVGSVLGGAIGSLFGPAGTLAGATVAGGLGSWIGGHWNRVRSAAISSQEDAIDQLRWAIKYGKGGSGYIYTKLAEKTGFVGADDMEAIAASAATFMPSVALGKVSADQWFALAQMPNTYAALMSGADLPELMSAHQADMGMYSAGWGMMLNNMLGWPDNARLLGGSGMLENVNRDTDIAERIADELFRLGVAVIPMYYDRGRKDVVARRDSYRTTATSAGPEYFRSIGPRMAGPAGRLLNRSAEEVALIGSLNEDILADRPASQLHPATVNVYVDGERAIQVNGMWTDDRALTDKVQYAAGSTQE